MGKHIFFIFLYIVFYNVFPPEYLYIVLIIHASAGILDNISTKSISLITIIYGGTILSSIANINLISKVNKGLVWDSIYNFIAIRHIHDAVLIWCIGCTCIFIGYDFCKKKSLPSIAFESSKKVLKIVFFSILALNVLNLTGHAINLSFIGSALQKIMTLVNIFSTLVFARLWKKENDRTYRSYALSLFFLQLYLALTTSFLRQDLIYPAFSLMVGYFLGLGKIKYVFTYRIIPFLLYILAFISVFKNLERSNFINIIYSDNKVTNTELVSEEEAKNANKGDFFDRLANLAQVTNCVKLVEQHGFYGGSASAPLVAAVIPRFLWPDKPQIQLGRWFAIEIGLAYVDDQGNVNNSINMTIPGELYIDFGWVGILLGCGLLGGLLALFWNAAQFNYSAYNLTGALWGGYLLQLGLGGFAGGDLQIVITLFSTYLILYVIKLIAKR